MNLNNLRTLGYDGPLGWPDVDPTEINYDYITTQAYQRTDQEAKSVDMSEAATEITDINNNDSDNLTASARQFLEMRFQIDETWEKLSAEIVSFSTNYLKNNTSTSSDNFNLSTQEQYNTAMGKILTMQAYALKIENLFTQLEKTNEESGRAYDVIDNSQRNTVGSGTATNNSAVNMIIAALAALLGAGTQGGASAGYNSYSETSSSGSHQNKMSTASAKSAFTNTYSKWISEIKASLQSIGYDDNGNVAFDYQGDFPRDVQNVSTEENTKQFQQDAYILDAMMCKNQVRSVWVFLQIGNIKFSTWNESNYIAGFDYKKNGSGSANSFTFDLVYAPPPGDSNINKLEKILSKRKIFFQYGYNESYNLCSPQYTGQILEYSVSTENNLLKYSIIGYSEASQSRSTNIEVPGYGAYFTTDEGENGELAYGIKATTYAQEILQQYLAPYNYKVIVEEEADSSNQETVIDKTEGSLFECVEQILSKAVLTSEAQKIITEKEKKKQELNDSTGIDVSSEDTEETAYFTYIINDAENEEGYKTVVIKRAMKLVELDDEDLIPSLVFTYGGKQEQTKLISDLGAQLTTEGDEDYNNEDALNISYENIVASSSKYTKGTYKMLANIVLNFSTEYNGSVTIAQAYTESNSNTQLSIDGEGNLHGSTALGSKDVTGETSIEDEKYSYWLWERNTMYSYNATLTMLGIPSDIPIGTYIYIRPIINGYEHHTGGFYYITGSEDKITDSGYTTTLSLLRVIDKDTDEILQLIDDVKERKARLKKSKQDYVEEYTEKYNDEEKGKEMGQIAWKDARIEAAFG